MPLYDYECKCGKTFCEYKEIKNRDNAYCPNCLGPVERLIAVPAVQTNFNLRDKAGERIWFPKDNRPYFDKGLRRTFNTPSEKKEFMDKHNLVMDGSSDKGQNSLSAEAGKARTGNRVTVNMGGKK